MARKFISHRKDSTSQHFWARGYYVSTVGRDEATVREYMKQQDQENRRLDQLSMFEE
jgi:putative transposase